MDSEQLKDALEASLTMPVENLREVLPDILDGVKEVGLENLLEQVPDAVPQLIQRLEEIDIKSFVESEPDTSARFMEVLWDSISLLAEKNAEAKAQLEKAGEVKANFVATDAPLEGNLVVSEGKFKGGSGLLEKCDISLSGPAESMVGLLTGSLHPITGFMGGKYKIEGDMVLGTQLVPIMATMTKLFKGA